MLANVDHAMSDEQLAALVAITAAEHEERSEFAGRRRSREAFEAMGEKIPEQLSEARDVAIVQAAHESYWLASAAGFIRGLDPLGLGGESLHVVSTDALAIDEGGLTGWTMPGHSTFEAVRDHLPVTAAPGPVLFVCTAAILRAGLPQLPDDATDSIVKENGRVWVTATAMHEVGHTIEMAAAGLNAPAGITMTHLRMLRQRPRVKRPHSAAWARTFFHLGHRADARPPAGYWLRFAIADIEHDIPGSDDEWRLLLANEAAVTDPDEPLINVIRRPFPDFDAAIERRRSTNKPNEVPHDID